MQILHEPIWLVGGATQAAGWVLQAAALDRGPLIVVQAITTLSLVIALPLGVRLTGQHVGRREIAAALAVVAGIVVFLAVGSPAGGTSNPSAAAWWAAGIVSVVLVAGVATIGRSRHGATRAALFGAAAGIGFALQAAVTKVFVGELGHGVAALLTTWSTYVLIVSALAGFVLQQSALKTGVLAAAMASSNTSTLVFSVVFGIVIFDERLTAAVGTWPSPSSASRSPCSVWCGSRRASRPRPAPRPDDTLPSPSGRMAAPGGQGSVDGGEASARRRLRAPRRVRVQQLGSGHEREHRDERARRPRRRWSPRRRSCSPRPAPR